MSPRKMARRKLEADDFAVDSEWRCVTERADPRIFDESANVDDRIAALRMCAQCDAAAACLERALNLTLAGGVWGGFVLTKGRVSRVAPNMHTVEQWAAERETGIAIELGLEPADLLDLIAV